MKSFIAIPLLIATAACEAATPDTNQDNVIETRDDWLKCGHLPGGDKNDSNLMVRRLIQGEENAAKWYTIAGGACKRLDCSGTTGLYVCNDKPTEVSLSGYTLHPYAKAIDDGCCTSAWYPHNKNRNGQRFTNLGWNVIISYANCNYGDAERPADTGGWDVNQSSGCV